MKSVVSIEGVSSPSGVCASSNLREEVPFLIFSCSKPYKKPLHVLTQYNENEGVTIVAESAEGRRDLIV